jgi:hypothetical protein
LHLYFQQLRATARRRSDSNAAQPPSTPLHHQRAILGRQG